MPPREYAQSSVIGAGAPSAARSRFSTGSVLERSSITGVAWAGLDVLTTLIGSLIAMHFRLDFAHINGLISNGEQGDSIWSQYGAYMGWFALCLVFFSRSYGLYGPIQNRSGLNEQRLTLQATLLAGLLLCGTIYLSRGERSGALWSTHAIGKVWTHVTFSSLDPDV